MKIAWFSAGCTSAVACKLALEKYPDAKVMFIETGSHHPDSARFMRDCAQWFGKKIEIVRSPYFINHWDVIERTRFINGPHGAACTRKLKREVRAMVEYEAERLGNPVSLSFYGFEAGEDRRAARFCEANPNTEFPLIDRRITKAQAHQIVAAAGIKLPAMYALGYGHNNCIGCVKGGAGYWNKIRRDFPEVFSRMAKLERHLGRACLKRDGEPLFLDALDPKAGRAEKMVMLSCGPDCESMVARHCSKCDRSEAACRCKVPELVENQMEVKP